MVTQVKNTVFLLKFIYLWLVLKDLISEGFWLNFQYKCLQKTILYSFFEFLDYFSLQYSF